MFKKIGLISGVVGLLVVGMSLSGIASENGKGFQCTAVASNGIGHGGETTWGDVEPTMAEAQASAQKKCDMGTSHGPCELESCWYNKQ